VLKEMTNRLEYVKTKIVLLWVFVMVNMIFADIFTFAFPSQGVVAQEMMLIYAMVTEIPIAMIFLSWVLKDKANRLLNIVASAITIPFIIAGFSAYLHYYFFAGVEIVCMALIILYSWKWPKQEVLAKTQS
jgi:hypothetical protein